MKISAKRKVFTRLTWKFLSANRWRKLSRPTNSTILPEKFTKETLLMIVFRNGL